MTVEEVKALLQESNEEDYKKAREKIDKIAKKHITDDTPIYYIAGKYNGFFAVGHKLTAFVEYDNQVILIIFDSFSCKARDQGPVHADLDISTLNNDYRHDNLKNCGSFLLEGSTLGDKKMFFKY
ncbi:MAG: hypothetical protein IKP07_05270, partial [Bacilli bacterium]|nr:hypothetical protein [Bacilli bacterium]